MLCHRGCGLESTHVNIKGQPCCFKAAPKCPVVKQKIGDASGATRRAFPCLRSDEHKEAQSKRIKEIWNTGGRVVSADQIERMRTLHTVRDGSCWNKGLTGVQVAWNKGLRKQEPMDILAREDPIYSNFKKYRNRVSTRTKKTYLQNKDLLNPLNLVLGKCGVDGAHQIDHIISVRVGFEQGITVELISAKENLQVIPWLENIQKYDGKGLRKSNKGK